MKLAEYSRVWPGTIIVALFCCLMLSQLGCVAESAGAKAAIAPQKGKEKEDKSDSKTTKHRNRLAKETSPYLLMHAHNPVNWYAWGPDAFAKAKKEGKLVFLSVGYSSCYWCHVMERESFNNPKVADLLNKWFVCIKVDREERPDVDSIYMTALTQVMQRRGGWPMSVFMTADGKPFFGGTYWPREDKQIQGQQIAGFISIVNKLHDISVKKPKLVQEVADRVAEETKRALETISPKLVLFELDRAIVDGTIDELTGRFDPEYGGYGRPPGFAGTKFPTPTNLELVLHAANRTKDAKKKKELLAQVTLTLDKMGRGGIYDHLGGGFHRYSTERTWTVPHFEKMLYDNGQLTELYAKAYRVTKKPLYRRILRETLAYVEREMMSPEGRFFSSQDAETEEEEGRSYVWTDAELRKALPEKKELELIRKVYGVEDGPNFEKKYHILCLSKALPQAASQLKIDEVKLLQQLEPIKQKLLRVRNKREQPFKNKISLTAWSGMMIAGFAEAGLALDEPHYIKTAKKAAEFILKNQKTGKGRLLRTFGAAPGKKAKADVPGYLEDYTSLVHGLLTLHEATKEKRWLKEAKELTETMIRWHGDKKRGGYYFTSHDHEKLFARSKDQYDGATPSGNSVAQRNLVRLWIATGEDRWRREAKKGFQAFALPLKNFPVSLTTMVHGLSLYLDHKQVAKKQPQIINKLAPPGGVKRAPNPVKVEFNADKVGEDGEQTITVKMRIDKGWHIYANPVGNDTLEGAATVLNVTRSKKAVKEVKIAYPDGEPVLDPIVGKYVKYTGIVKLTATVNRKQTPGEIEISVRFQACDANRCLPPKTVAKKIK